MSTLSTVLHLSGALYFGYGLLYDQMFVASDQRVPDKLNVSKFGYAFNGRVLFLTLWCLTIQTLYYTTSFINDLIESTTLKRLRHFLLATIVFPVSAFVAITFWAIWAVDRELVFPRAFDVFFPAWLNHLMHTAVLVFSTTELLTTPMVYPKRSTGLKTFTAFMVTYLVWVHVVWYQSGFWIYPILAVLNVPLKLVFYVACLAFSLALFILGEMLHGAVHGTKSHGKGRNRGAKSSKSS